MRALFLFSLFASALAASCNLGVVVSTPSQYGVIGFLEGTYTRGSTAYLDISAGPPVSWFPVGSDLYVLHYQRFSNLVVQYTWNATTNQYKRLRDFPVLSGNEGEVFMARMNDGNIAVWNQIYARSYNPATGAIVNAVVFDPTQFVGLTGSLGMDVHPLTGDVFVYGGSRLARFSSTGTQLFLSTTMTPDVTGLAFDVGGGYFLIQGTNIAQYSSSNTFTGFWPSLSATPLGIRSDPTVQTLFVSYSQANVTAYTISTKIKTFSWIAGTNTDLFFLGCVASSLQSLPQPTPASPAGGTKGNWVANSWRWTLQNRTTKCVGVKTPGICGNPPLSPPPFNPYTNCPPGNWRIIGANSTLIIYCGGPKTQNTWRGWSWTPNWMLCTGQLAKGTQRCWWTPSKNPIVAVPASISYKPFGKTGSPTSGPKTSSPSTGGPKTSSPSSGSTGSTPPPSSGSAGSSNSGNSGNSGSTSYVSEDAASLHQAAVALGIMWA